MRTTTLALNALVVLFFTAFLGYTVVAREHLDRLARGFVTEKTLQYSGPIVEIADESLDSPLVQKLLSDEQAAAVRQEIFTYREDGPAYIEDLTRQRIQPRKAGGAIPMLEKVSSIKERIRTYYDETLSALIRDLRIFSGSNLCAGVIAFVLAYRSPRAIHRAIVWFSFFMFVAVLYCSYLYVDELTFFRILFQTHLGWWYPVSLCAVVAGIFLNYGPALIASHPLDKLEQDQPDDLSDAD